MKNEPYEENYPKLLFEIQKVFEKFNFSDAEKISFHLLEMADLSAKAALPEAMFDELILDLKELFLEIRGNQKWDDLLKKAKDLSQTTFELKESCLNGIKKKT